MTMIKRRALVGLTAGLLAMTGMVGIAYAQTSLTLFSPNDQAAVAYTEAMVAAFEAANPDIKVEIEVGPGGTERDNMVKSRLATGTMNDVFVYNTGSLFQAINPVQSTVDLSSEAYMSTILDSFKQTVTATDGTLHGVPYGQAMGGGVLYNKRIYEELGLSVPKTWDEFMANNAKIKEAGKAPVIQTFGDTWTSQLFFLADYYNIQAVEPDFAAKYTTNEAKYAGNVAAMGGFQKQADVYNAGYLNEDYGAAVLDDGLRMLAQGDGAHYPMLTFAVGTIAQNYPDLLNDVGYFGLPGNDAAKNGTTVWMPTALYISANSPNVEAAKKLVAFVASKEGGCDPWVELNAITGPFLIQGCELPASVPTAVSDLGAYFTAEGQTAPALEFLSPVKGPNLENITVEVGSGIRTPEDAAALYDEDVKKQAQQLGLPGW
ncbi:ABC transporter substrate-binding protein [Devosia sp. Root685]|uniref:ABC transporter substrate-binding protein n=1 Tax=Devosia sp. Root685 TaxID=1736587 RepID=UPI000701ECF1|nr:ABC transporter substrate-binding protein [Devosia sp. Root685]KRA98026.1 ABC transporter substrate-binding protein [Devosia sp. Root685]